MAVALFARFPRLFTKVVSQPVIPAADRPGYPALAADLATVDRVVAPAFARFDRGALRDQNRYRRQQVLLLVGSTVIAALGGVQAALSDLRWLGVVVGFLGLLLPLSARLVRERETLTGYLDARVKAERLRSLHFEFLSGTGRYAGDDRERRLAADVRLITEGKEPA